MSTTTKFAGFVAGLSAVAAIGVAVAQGVPPNPYIANPALGAGQQSTHITSMGETGVPGFIEPLATATITRQEEVAVLPPAPVAQAQPEPMLEPAPAPVAQAEPEPAPTVMMGAAPSAPEPEPMRVARYDRN